jgi:hypothetical protein
MPLYFSKKTLFLFCFFCNFIFEKNCPSITGGCNEAIMHDGICNDINNITGCGFDGGDCLDNCKVGWLNNGILNFSNFFYR